MLTMMQCENATRVYDYNIAWIDKTPEKCGFKYCVHNRCSKCRDLDYKFVAFQYRDGKKL